MKIKKTLNFKGPINVHHDHIRSLKKINKYLIKISILLAQGVHASHRTTDNNNQQPSTIYLLTLASEHGDVIVMWCGVEWGFLERHK